MDTEAIGMETQQSIEGFRLSPQQERLWRAAGGQDAPAWRARVSVEIAGDLDRKILGGALAAVIERHEILRTAFRTLPGLAMPLQMVTGSTAVELRDTVDDPAFDLAEPPLVRAALAPLGDGRHLLTLTMPPLLADAAGLENLVRELAAVYSAARGESGADEEPMQYIDLSEWQHDLLASEETREGREYWQKRAIGAIRPPALPFERATGESFEPRSVPVPTRMPGGREILLAAWAVLLARLTGESEIPVGVVFDGRKLDELAGALGPFARLLPVRVRIGEETRFADLARSLQGILTEHAQWQEYFAEEPDGEAVLPFTFELRGAPAVHRAGGATFTVRERRARLAAATLELLVEEDGRAEIGYDAARISETEALRLAERFAALVAGAAARPESRVAELDLLGAGERRLFMAWNDTAVDFGVEPVLHLLVQAQAARTPDRAAVEWDGGRWTYAELEERASRLTRLLLRRGVKPEDRVAICCERSPEMVAAQLAVWKAGAAWVPLDPSSPAERLAFLLEDARPAVLIAGPGAPADLAPGQAILLDLRTEELADIPEELPGGQVGPDRLAYVIYTSGSTGRPKGVMVPHGAIANRLLWMQRAFPLGADDTVLQKTPFLFDASIWELFLPLLAGARLVLAAPGAHQDPAALTRAVRERKVTVLQLVPSMLGPFLDEDLAGSPLRRLFCGGEALPAPLHERACQRLPGVEVCNLYGPTECAIDVTFHPCGTGAWGGSVMPIGQPVDNVRIHLLDRRLIPVPLGLAGELCAGGAGLARGYLGRPDLTAERFIPDPAAAEPGGRLYRTGDLVRQGADGTIEFLGRIDHQVKIRGYRIELGEIESCLAAHPAVAEAVVTVREDSPEDRRLAAYLVPRAGESATDSELREHLAARLPEPMLPSSWTRLPALPRLPSGKIDRAALPAPSVAGEDGGFAAPRTPTEELLAARWAEVLGVERLGRHDNVYALGWHSLLATRFVSRLRRTFGVELPMRSLFENPTVAGLAARIDEALRGGGGAVPPVAQVTRDGVLPLSFAQRRLWFLDQLQSGSPFYNIPVALRFAGSLDAGSLGRSLSEIVARHESLRTRFSDVDDEPVQLIDPPAPVSLPVVDLGALPEERRVVELRARIAEEALAPFDLTAGPLLRATLVRLAPDEHAGLLTVHHIVSDGWSTAVLVRELRTLYAAFAAGRPSPLPPLPLQYADFAVWQRGWLQGEVLDAQVEYWAAQLGGAPPLLALPTDRKRPDAQSFRGATRGRALPAEVAAAVRELARGEGVTLFMAMLAAGATLLGWHAGQEDVVIGTDVAGRDRGETEGVIGFFINQLALRLRLGGDPTFRELLGRARETALGAYAHQDLPFDRLVEVLNPERGRRHAPVFQVKINLHDEPPPALDLPGVSIEPLAVARETAQFDWILNLMDAGDSFLASVEYATDLFDAATIDRMLGNFEALLRTAGERPDVRLRELAAVLAESDTRQREAASAERRQGKQQSLKTARRQVVGATA
jgi:amino acid adenylation domain-containing protein